MFTPNEKHRRVNGVDVDWWGKPLKLNQEVSQATVEGKVVPASWTLLPDDMPFVSRLRAADVHYIEELPLSLEDIPGIGASTADKIYAYLQGDEEE